MKFSKLVSGELTVFIKVKIDNLKDVSLLIPETVRNNDKILREITNITTDKKYLLISEKSKFIFEKVNLFINIFFGLLKDKIWFIENLNRE